MKNPHWQLVIHECQVRDHYYKELKDQMKAFLDASQNKCEEHI